MPSTPRRPGLTPLRRLSIVALSAAMLASGTIAQATARTLPTPGAASGADRAGAPTSPSTAAALPSGILPTIHYEDALAHADDQIAFAPGGRVTRGFTPRTGDRWTVGGVTPQALPAGRLSGRDMRDGATAPAATPSATAPAATPSTTAETAPVPTLTPEPAPTASSEAIPEATAEPTPGPIDAPSVDPSAAIDADGAAFVAPTAEGDNDLAARVSPAGLRREVFGFLPYWELSDASTTLDFTKLSTIAYFGVGAAANGNLEKTNSDGSTTVGWSGWTSSRMTTLINEAHAGRTRVVLTVQSFAWSTGGADKQRALLGSSANRANLARQIAKAVTDRGADGVNLDFEPLASGYAEEFTALVRSVRYELDKVAAGYQITFDTTGWIGNYPLEDATAPGGADAIFIMGYDYRSSGSSNAGSIAPLSNSGYDITDTIVAYLDRVPASKLILGVPYYGRAWSTQTDQLHSTNISGTQYGASAAVIYASGIEVLQEKGRKYDSGEGVAWTAYRREHCTATYGCVTPWRQLYLDDATALKAKYDLINRFGLRGAGIWALGYDDERPELWSAIQTKFVTDTTAPVVGITRLSSVQLSPSFTVKWNGYDESGIARYDVQVAIDGGSWSAWKTGATATSAPYVGRDDRRYAFRVRATDIKGNASTWSNLATAASPSGLAVGGFGMVRVDGLTLRSGPTTSASALGSASTNNLMAITDGPVSADGYTWYEVSGPLKEWPAVTPVQSGVWLAASSASATNMTAANGPHQTRVGGSISGLSFRGRGSASLGSSEFAKASRKLSPNGDGFYDSLSLYWTNEQALDSLELRIFRSDGSTAGVVDVPRLTSGDKIFPWNGTVGGTRVPNGAYLLALVGKVGTTTYANPASSFATSELLGVYGVRVADVLHPYTDVSSFARAIEWMYMEGITAGCTTTRYCPDDDVTRAQMAAFLVRALDLPAATTDYFDDDDGTTGESSINALARAGITGGCGTRRFCPSADVTRLQMAQFLDRALDLPAATTDYFDDDDGRTGEASVNALAKAGITSGCGPRRYCPASPVERGEMAAFLYRAVGD